MVKRIYLLITIMLLGSCGNKLHDLIMVRTPYLGNELRIDGYYYTYPIYENDINIAVFYRNGVCMHIQARSTSQDIFDFVENDILLNDAFISRLKDLPACIGIFQINMESIEFEIWDRDYHDTYSVRYFGEILNDTTFLVTKRVDKGTKKSYSINDTYRFKQFSPKPDSTNVYIK